jgi:hypothetical protein
MVLMLDELAAITRVHSDLDGPRPQRLARTLDRLGFGAGFATPRYAAPAPLRPSRRRDSVASEWHPL